MSFRVLAYLFKRYILRCRYLLVTIPHYELSMRVLACDTLGRHLSKYGAHEREITEFLCREIALEDGDIAIDGGAHVGWYSLILHKIAAGTSARIIAFEPNPNNLSLLKENLQRNAAHSVTVVQKGLANVVDRMTLYLEDDKNTGHHSLLPINTAGQVEVETTTLNSYWKEAGLEKHKLKFIKLDIEGFELIALRGATDLLGSCPLIMLEYSPKFMKAGGLDPQKLFTLMASYDYRPYRLVDGALQAADTTELLESMVLVNLFWRK